MVCCVWFVVCGLLVVVCCLRFGLSLCGFVVLVFADVLFCVVVAVLLFWCLVVLLFS